MKGSTITARRVLVMLPLMAALAAHSGIGGGIGTNIGDFTLFETSGGSRSLSSYKGNLVVLAFWSFRCPVALAYDARVRALQEKYGPRGVVVLAVSSSQNESPEELRLNASNLKLPFPILLDREAVLADKLGITHLPGFVIVDQGSVVRYAGAFDNNKRPDERGRVAYAEQALESLLAGNPVATAETPFFGCSLRRRAP